MKKALFIAFMAFSIMATAQVNQTTKLMSAGTHHAYSIQLEGADFKKAEKVWKEYNKPYGKYDKDRKNKEFRAHSISIPSISYDRNFSVTIKLDASKNRTTAFVFFEDESGFLGSDDPLTDKMADFVEHYKYEVDRTVMREKLKEEEDQLKKFNKELSKLENKNEDYHEEIKKCEKKIKEAEEDIEQNLKDQDEKNYEISEQQKFLEKLTEELNNIGNKGSSDENDN